MFVDNGEGRQGSLFVETAGPCAQMFFDQLKKHPVPVEEAAVRQIANNDGAPMSIAGWPIGCMCFSAPTRSPGGPSTANSGKDTDGSTISSASSAKPSRWLWLSIQRPRLKRRTVADP